MNMAAKGNGAFLSNDLIFQWYNQSGTMGCINEIFEHFPGAKRNETEKRSLRSKISHLVNSLKRSKGIDRSETLKKEFKGRLTEPVLRCGALRDIRPCPTSDLSSPQCLILSRPPGSDRRAFPSTITTTTTLTNRPFRRISDQDGPNR